jgi:NADPH2:quinone reductase
MRMMVAKQLNGYRGLEQVEAPKPQVTDGSVVVRVRAAGVTPLEHTIVEGGFPRAKSPLVLGNKAPG